VFYTKLPINYNALTKTPDATTTKFSLKLHSICPPEYTMTVKPTLHELALVPAEITFSENVLGPL
jgi:hypothetical protein